jgi:hypothetical protein
MMAARRLLLVMIVLLVLSSLAAALVPPPPEPSGTTAETTTAERPGKQPRAEPRRRGRLVSESVAAEGPPRRIVLAPGDQLSLRVTSRRFAQVAIPGLGLLDSAAPGSPARFDLLAPAPGAYRVRALAGGRTIARIVVRDPRS